MLRNLKRFGGDWPIYASYIAKNHYLHFSLFQEFPLHLLFSTKLQIIHNETNSTRPICFVPISHMLV